MRFFRITQRLSVVFFLLLIIACRKHTLPAVSTPLPEQPGTDTTVVPNPPDDPDDVDTIPDVPQPAMYHQVAVHERMGKNVGGYYEALPPAYDSANDTYPLLIFLHGGGELGDGSPSALPLILKNSLTRRLHEQNFPTNFIVGADTFSFIIISPQFAEWPKVPDVNDVLEYCLSKYRVDRSRIYLSGLSMGGGATWEYAGSQYGSQLAAIVPICGASWADSAVAKRIASNQVPAWAFHNEDDDAVTVKSTTRYARLVNAENPKYPVKVTLWPTGGHDAWTKASDPLYREDEMNMYEWMLQYVRKK